MILKLKNNSHVTIECTLKPTINNIHSTCFNPMTNLYVPGQRLAASINKLLILYKT